MFLWLVKQDWCETILEQMWGSTSLGRGGAFTCFIVVEHLDVSGVASLMERLSSKSCLIKRWRKKRCSTHRNSSRQL